MSVDSWFGLSVIEESGLVLALTTEANAERAQQLAEALLERHLVACVSIPYGRTLPSPDGLRAALRAGLPPDHLAVVRPLQGEVPGAIERSLCRRWGIGVVLCRQSGGVTEQLWHQLTTDLGLSLLLLRRPSPPDGMECVEDVCSLMDRLERD